MIPKREGVVEHCFVRDLRFDALYLRQPISVVVVSKYINLKITISKHHLSGVESIDKVKWCIRSI